MGIDNIDDPESKLARSGVGGRGAPIPGRGGLPASFGYGGGSVFGSNGAASFGTDGALRTLLRKRLALPSTSPSYLSGGETSFAESGTRPGAMPSASVSGILGKSGLFGTQQGGGPTQYTGDPEDWRPEGTNPAGDPVLGFNEWTGSGWDRSRTINQLYDLLKQYADAGSFSPTGSSALMDATRSEAMSNADALRQRGKLIGSNLGVDPSTAAGFALQSDLNTQGGVADALNSAVTGRLNKQDDFGKSILSALANFNMQDWQMERQGDISKRYAPEQSGGGLGGFLGGVAGRALGGWLSPGGFWGGGGRN